jgi:hypothetical protein
MARFWLFYYLTFGPKYTRWALLVFALVMGFFFFCFVHEAFDSSRLTSSMVAAKHSKAVKATPQNRAVTRGDALNRELKRPPAL